MWTSMVDFLNSIIDYLISNWIAIFSLSLSVYTIISNRIKLDVNIRSDSQWLIAVLHDDGQSLTNEFGLVQANIKIINPSNTDISYFDLKVVNSDTGENLHYYSDSQRNIYNGLENSKAIAGLLPSKEMIKIDLPEADFGIIKSRSVTSIDIIISPENKIENVFIVFKVTKRKVFFKKPKYGYIKSPYETYCGTFLVIEADKPDYEKVYSQLQKY